MDTLMKVYEITLGQLMMVSVTQWIIGYLFGKRAAIRKTEE